MTPLSPCINYVQYYLFIRELKQTDAAAVNRQISIQLMSAADWIHLALSPFEWRFACYPPRHGRRVSLLKFPIN